MSLLDYVETKQFLEEIAIQRGQYCYDYAKELEQKLAVCVRALKEISLNQCTAMAWDMTKAPTIGTSVCSHHIAKQALSEIGEK